jgi:hypothetical protein
MKIIVSFCLHINIPMLSCMLHGHHVALYPGQSSSCCSAPHMDIIGRSVFRIHVMKSLCISHENYPVILHAHEHSNGTLHLTWRYKYWSVCQMNIIISLCISYEHCNVLLCLIQTLSCHSASQIGILIWLCISCENHNVSIYFKLASSYCSTYHTNIIISLYISHEYHNVNLYLMSISSCHSPSDMNIIIQIGIKLRSWL